MACSRSWPPLLALPDTEATRLLASLVAKYMSASEVDESEQGLLEVEVKVCESRGIGDDELSVW